MGWKRSRRLVEVERRLIADGWHGGWLDALATEAGCSRRTIERDRLEVLERLRDEEVGGDRETRRTRLLLGLQRDRRAARSADAWGPVMRSWSLEAQVLGLNRIPPRPPPLPDDPDADPLERQLRQVQALLHDAQARGSMVSAAKLSQQESELQERIEEKRRRAEERRKLSEDEEAIVNRFAEAAGKLPAAVAERLAEVLRELVDE